MLPFVSLLAFAFALWAFALPFGAFSPFRAAAFRQGGEQSGEGIYVHRRGSSAPRVGGHLARVLRLEVFYGLGPDLVIGRKASRHELKMLGKLRGAHGYED